MARRNGKEHRPIVTLTTDYGTRDYYAAAMKGVIAGIAPRARIVDITHDVPPHDVLHAAMILCQIWPWYAPGTVHAAVVDPGVGTTRRILLARYGGRYAIAPDNGLLTLVHRTMGLEMMHVVQNRRFMLPESSSTFHGRDIIAPVAAHLASGVAPGDFGNATNRIELLPIRHRAEQMLGRLRGEVLYIDRFGTLVTNIHSDQLSGDPKGIARAAVDGVDVGPLRTTFADVAAGEPLAVIGSTGFLEIAVNRGRAVDRFGSAPKVDLVVGKPALP